MQVDHIFQLQMAFPVKAILLQVVLPEFSHH